jgi:bifunctional N-acetylglucosamine-1-phosphate-uridyltransferase/glucosamine-1-phosphate-acetyltransferase GlmU-like protein
LLASYDPKPVVVVSPAGRSAIAECLERYGLTAELVEQTSPTGMGDAVLCFEKARAPHQSAQLLTVWGDIPMLQQATVEKLVSRHLSERNDFTFATRIADDAYTIVDRDSLGRVVEVKETRELGIVSCRGEREIGLFLFRVEPVFKLLRRRLSGSSGKRSGEHGFLYVVKHLIERGYKVEGLPIATELDSISLNYVSDVASLELRSAR